MYGRRIWLAADCSILSFLLRSRKMIFVTIYASTSSLSKVNDARMELFCHGKQSMENLPPTQDALHQHVKRAIYRASIWSIADEPAPQIPSAGDFGWKKVDEWKPVWITISEAGTSCRELFIKCNCKGNCSTCKCGEANLHCTHLCHCNCAK